MKYLLDTHVWLWMMLSPEHLNDEARATIASKDNHTLVSVASAWEVVVKQSIGRLPLVEAVEHLVESSARDFELTIVPILLEHVTHAAGLPPLHNDPFDRVLIAQAHIENATLVTADDAIRQYGGSLLWAAEPART